MPPLIHIDPHNGVPAYRQLMDQLKLQIATGVLPAGAELPSTRVLSADLRLNPMTISKAYSLLERDGLLERRRGQTLTVSEQKASDAGQKLEPLRQQLEAAAALARTLDISNDEAVALFQRALNNK